jgi:hypothetical protein
LWRRAVEPRIAVALELESVEQVTGGPPGEVEVVERAPWRAIYELAANKGRAVIAEVRLEPTNPADGRPLSAQLARELVKPSAALDFGRKGLLAMVPHDDSREQRAREEWLVKYGLDPTQLGAERRGKRQPDYFYAALAARYVEAHTSGSRRPVADVADQLPLGYESSFVRDALSKARERGLLERSSGQRQAGGEFTARGRHVLEEGPPDGYVGPGVAPSVAPSAARGSTGKQKPPD